MFRRILGRQHRMSQGGGRVTHREFYVPKGVRLAQRYEVLDYLGEGGFSRTYIAGDILRPGMPRCVVKHLQPANPDPEFLQDAWRLFQQEAEILEKLGNHDQIPRLLAYFRDEQEFYLVQEFILGEPLSAALKAGKPWQESEVFHLLQQVLTVLTFVHDHRVIHRDIKPDNLIRRQDDRKIVLVDFGAVKQIRQTQVVKGHTSVTISVGTHGYMPPEQYSGKPRPSSDLYALGITAIQALTGLPPEAFKDDLEADERSWQQHVQVDSSLADVITKMVKYRAIERYPSATEALEALMQLSDRYSALSEPEHPEAIPISETIVSYPIPELRSVSIAPEVPPVSPTSAIQEIENNKNNSFANPELETRQQPFDTEVQPVEPQATLDQLSETREPALVREIPTRNRVIWFGSGAVLCTIAVFITVTLQNRPPQVSSPPSSVQAPEPMNPDQATFDQAISMAQSGNLDKAIEKIQTIPDSSSLYTQAQEKAFSWQARLVQNYLRSEVPKKNPNLKDLIDSIKPTIEAINADQITIRYDSSANADFASDRGLRIITALFMGRLRGNPRENIPAYRNLAFKELHVFHQQSDQKAILSDRDWNTYVRSTADEETLFNKVQLIARK